MQMYEIRDPHARPFYQTVQGLLVRAAACLRSRTQPPGMVPVGVPPVATRRWFVHTLGVGLPARGCNTLRKQSKVPDGHAGNPKAILDAVPAELYPQAYGMAGSFGDVPACRQ